MIKRCSCTVRRKCIELIPQALALCAVLIYRTIAARTALVQCIYRADGRLSRLVLSHALQRLTGLNNMERSVHLIAMSDDIAANVGCQELISDLPNGGELK